LKVQSPSLFALFVLLWGVGANGSSDRRARYAAARQTALDDARTLKAALHARDAQARRLWRRPGLAACAALAESAVNLDAAWSRYVDALRGIEQAARPFPDYAETARVARKAAVAERTSDVRHTARWSAWCAALPPRAAAASGSQASSQRVCDVERFGPVIVRRQASIDAEDGATLRHTRWLAARFDDTLDLLAVIYMSGLASPVDDVAHVWIDRGTPGVGAAPFKPGHLPRWRRLQAAVAIDGARTDLRSAPSLRALVRRAGNRWVVPGCPRPHEGWGYSNVGGQLGGAARLETIAAGRYRLVPARADGRSGLVGNGGNALPYAPIEQYLLGHRPLDAVGSLTFLRGVRRRDDGLVDAEGRCVLDAARIRTLFGERPLRATPLTMGVLIVATPETPAYRIDAQRRAAEIFMQPGPDDDPLLFNYFEATQGRGRLAFSVPPPRRCVTNR
jgi:hypothetical protein